MHADQVIDSYTNGGSWSSFRSLESGVNGMIPELIGAAAIGSSERIVFGAVNGGYNSGQEHTTYLPRYTTYNGTAQWTQTYYNFGNATPFGAFAVKSNTSGIDVAWQDRTTFSYWYQHFNAVSHSWGQITNTANWDAPLNLGGAYMNPPAMTYGSDGAIYVLGVGFDDALYATRITGGSFSGPNATGLVGIL